MTDGRQCRFVSKGFEGVTLVSGTGTDKPLLEGRSSRLASEGVTPAEHAMTKTALIGAVAESVDMSPSDAARAVESVFENITLALKSGVAVHVVGFGTFSVSKRKRPNDVRRKSGGDDAVSLARPTFKPGKTLRDAVN